MTRPALLLTLLLVTGIASGAAAGESWRLYAAGVPFRWISSDGQEKGHRADCRLRACEMSDSATGNLDNSIGFRFGLERVVAGRGAARLLGGVEANLMSTEYNLSQRDFLLAEALAVAGGDLEVGPVRLLARGGLGRTFSDDHPHGPARFVEAGLELPLSPALGVRVAARRGHHAGPATKDISVAFVSTPGAGRQAASWALVWSAGLTVPGSLAGDHLRLGTAPLMQVSLHRRLASGRDRIGLSLGAVAHESTLRSDYGSTPGNQRGRELPELALVWDRDLGVRRPLRLLAGLRMSSFEDQHALLKARDGTPIEGSVAFGLSAGLEAEPLRLGEVMLVTAVEQVYWPAFRLAELRTRVGLGFRP